MTHNNGRIRYAALIILALALLLSLWTSASADTIVKSVDLNYSAKKINLNTAWLEGEVQQRIRETVSVSTAGCSLDVGNTFLSYEGGTSQWWGIGDGSTRVQKTRKYAIMYCIKLSAGYDWYPQLKELPRINRSIQECPDFYVYTNGTRNKSVYINYNENSDYLYITVPLGYPSTKKIVTSMSINGGNFSMGVGTSNTFKVTMEGSITDKSVTWSVSGNKSSKTKITTAGKLTIGSDETAAKLTVKAVSKQDTSASAKVTVTVTKKAPTITSVTVSPDNPTGYTDNSLWLFATVKGTQTDKSVTWKILDAKSPDTTISDTGLLHIGRNEPAGSVRVRVTANRDTSKYAVAVITVKKAEVCSKLSLSYNAEAIALSPAYTEGEVNTRMAGTGYIGLKTKGFTVQTPWPLNRLEGSSMVGIGNGSAKVSQSKNYYFSLSLVPQAGKMWPDSVIKLDQSVTVPLTKVEGLSVSVNGKTIAKSKVFVKYYSSNNTLWVYAPAQFSIDIAAAKVTGITASTPYTGKVIKPVPTVKAYGKTLIAGTDYKVTYSKNKNAGKATVKISGLGDFTGVLVKHFTIKPVELTKIKCSKTSVVYNGKKQTPSVKVYAKVDGKTKLLTKDTDYTVTYKNNKNAGTATVTAKGKGNFKGTVSATFTIKKLSLSGATAKLSKTVMKYTGKALKPDVTVTIQLNGKTVTLEKGTDYTVSYANNINKGTATVTVKGKGNYSGTITLSFTIKK